MKIKEWLSQHGNDFWCTYECEHCGHETKEQSGYNDANFHNNVIPAKHCSDCGLNRSGENESHG